MLRLSESPSVTLANMKHGWHDMVSRFRIICIRWRWLWNTLLEVAQSSP
jgi:hypothetical protein